MKALRCHITDKKEYSRRCHELRSFWGTDSCPKVCGRLPYGFKQYFQNKKRKIDYLNFGMNFQVENLQGIVTSAVTIKS